MIFLILLLIVLIFIVLIVLFAYSLFNNSVKNNSVSLNKQIEKHNMTFDIKVDVNVDWLKIQEYTDEYIKSKDGLSLHATYLKANNPNKTVICVHGYRGTGESDFSAIIKYFNQNHTNVLLIDQRGCGQSEGSFITFGAKEKEDLKLWIEYTINKLDNKNPLYVYGISMGATTTLLTLGYKHNNNLKGVICDSGFTSMKDQLNYLLHKWYHIPGSLIISVLNIFCNVIAGFDVKETDTTLSLKDNTVPIMFVHGEDDTFVLPENTRLNYSRTNGPKEIFFVKGANHAESLIKNPEMYHAKLEFFFKTYK